MTISLKQRTPFYLLRQEPVPNNETTGATNLMQVKGLEHSYNKLSTKKMKDNLSSFLPNMPGMIDSPGGQDNSSLRGIIDKPPVCGKELLPLNQLQLAGFRLHPGPLPEQYRSLTQMQTKKKHKKRRYHKIDDGSLGGDLDAGDDSMGAGGSGQTGATPTPTPGGGGGSSRSGGDEEREKKREKKHKKHDKDAEERKKKKKEKKRKKNKEDKEF